MAYIVDQDIYDVYGKDNVRKWADVDNKDNNSTIVSRINWAIAHAEDELNSRLNGGPYRVPLTGDGGGNFDQIVKTNTARLAGIALYDSRGIIDSDPDENDQLQVFRKMVDKFVRQIHGQQIKLILEETKVITYPTVLSTE